MSSLLHRLVTIAASARGSLSCWSQKTPRTPLDQANETTDDACNAQTETTIYQPVGDVQSLVPKNIAITSATQFHSTQKEKQETHTLLYKVTRYTNDRKAKSHYE